jgi:hypothetical protein
MAVVSYGGFLKCFAPSRQQNEYNRFMYPKYFDFLFEPALKEIFVRFRGIYSRDENGKSVKIELTRGKSVAEYCDKIKIGETLNWQ